MREREEEREKNGKGKRETEGENRRRGNKIGSTKNDWRSNLQIVER